MTNLYRDDPGYFLSAFQDFRDPKVVSSLLVITLLNIALNYPGLSWGLPGMWHPDEALRTIVGAIRKGEIPYNHPHYPNLYLYFLYAAWKFLSPFFSWAFTAICLRAISLLISSFVLVLIFLVSRNCGLSKWTSLIASTLLMTSTGFSDIAHFAHNNIYVLLFIVTSTLLLQEYLETKRIRWFYFACTACGLATGCKYNGALIIPVLLGSMIILSRKDGLKTIFVRSIIGGFAVLIPILISLPKAVMRPKDFFIFNFEKLFKAYFFEDQGWSVGFPPGYLGQWGVMSDSASPFLFYGIACTAIGFAAVHLAKFFTRKQQSSPWGINKSAAAIVTLLAVMDIPILVSRTYTIRHLVPLVPFMAIIFCFLLEYVWTHCCGTSPFLKSLFVIVITVGLIHSALRVVSLNLLFLNDARLSAGAYISEMIPEGSSIEVLAYPPNIDKSRYKIKYYPFQFRLFNTDSVPPGYNLGCEGFKERNPDYIVIDSFTYQWHCFPKAKGLLHAPDCVCWDAILKGKAGYTLFKEISYSLPPFLPSVQGEFVNPIIYILKNGRDHRI